MPSRHQEGGHHPDHGGRSVRSQGGQAEGRTDQERPNGQRHEPGAALTDAHERGEEKPEHGDDGESAQHPAEHHGLGPLRVVGDLQSSQPDAHHRGPVQDEPYDFQDAGTFIPPSCGVELQHGLILGTVEQTQEVVAAGPLAEERRRTQVGQEACGEDDDPEPGGPSLGEPQEHSGDG